MNDTYMRFYEHGFYKKIKQLEIKQNNIFYKVKNTTSITLANTQDFFIMALSLSLQIDVKKERKKTGKHFKQYAKDVLSKYRMTTKQDLKWFKYYFLTNTEIDRYIDRDFHYNIIEFSAIKIPTYEQTGTYGKYHLVHIISELDEEEKEI